MAVDRRGRGDRLQLLTIREVPRREVQLAGIFGEPAFCVGAMEDAEQNAFGCGHDGRPPVTLGEAAHELSGSLARSHRAGPWLQCTLDRHGVVIAAQAALAHPTEHNTLPADDQAEVVPRAGQQRADDLESVAESYGRRVAVGEIARS
jgi:hypothetical protein